MSFYQRLKKKTNNFLSFIYFGVYQWPRGTFLLVVKALKSTKISLKSPNVCFPLHFTVLSHGPDWSLQQASGLMFDTPVLITLKNRTNPVIL